jgi:hypothetical protein
MAVLGDRRGGLTGGVDAVDTDHPHVLVDLEPADAVPRAWNLLGEGAGAHARSPDHRAGREHSAIREDCLLAVKRLQLDVEPDFDVGMAQRGEDLRSRAPAELRTDGVGVIGRMIAAALGKHGTAG